MSPIYLGFDISEFKNALTTIGKIGILLNSDITLQNKEEINTMKDVFKDAKVGDKVWSVTRGWGKITENNSFDIDDDYPIAVKHRDNDEHNYRYYTTSGRIYANHAYPDIFWKEGVVNEVTERPQSEIDWNKVPQGTLVMIKDSANGVWIKRIFAAYVANANFPFYVYDILDTNEAECLEEYGYCKVHPDVEIKKEWLK